MRVNRYEYNPAAKQKKLIAAWEVSRSRKHGRPRGRGVKITKIRQVFP